MNIKTLPQKARLAGFFYLVYIIFTILTDVLRSRFIVPDNAAFTAQNLTSSGWLFRLGFVGDLLAGLLFFLTAWALYTLLKPVDENLARLFMLLNLGGVAIQCANDLNLLAALLLTSDASYLNVFTPAQLQALALACLNLHKQGFWICQIFFGAWLFPLGYLVFKSGYLPKILGIILMVHCVGWLMTFGQYFLFQSFSAITYLTYPLGLISELGLTFWLLIVGVREQKPL